MKPRHHGGVVGTRSSAAPAHARPAIPAPILETRLVAIGRGLDPARIVEVGEALVSGGVRAFEVTLNSRDAVTAIRALAGRFHEGELLVGAGTVLDLDAAESAVSAGAAFIVTPHTDPDLVAWAAARGIPALPGAFTPTEILTAWRAGAAAIKLFPASVAGPAFVREFRGPFPDIPIVPTGGVTVETGRAFLDAGAAAVALGSWLTGTGDVGTIGSRAREAIEAFRRMPG